MKAKKLFLYVVSVAIAAAGVSAADLSVESVVALTLAKDSTIAAARLDVVAAQYAKRSARAGVLPQVTLDSREPLRTLGYSRRTSVDRTAFPPAETEIDIYSYSALISVSQVLPTDGSVSLSFYNTGRAESGSGDTVFTQEIGLSARYRQPLFVNGKILDLAMFDAGQELAADLPLRLARSGADALRNAEVLAVLESYFAVIELRNSVQLLSRNIETSAERVEQLRIRQRQGTVTRRQVWDKEIELDKLREARLEAEYALLAAEYSLQAGIGSDVDVSDLTLGDRLPTVASPPPVGESLERAYEQNVSVNRAREQIRQAQLQTIVNGRRYAANLSASVQLAPNPSPLYEGAADIGSSYEELFSDESKWQPTVSLGLSVPLYTGGRARLQRRQDEAAERRAQLALQDSQHQLEQSVEALYLRRRLLEDQRALRESALTLERERLSETKTLASLQTATDLDIREAEAQVLARENDLWRTRADLTLNALRIQQVSGNDLPSVLGVED